MNRHSRELQRQRVRNIHQSIETLPRPELDLRRASRDFVVMVVSASGLGGVLIYVLDYLLVHGTSWHITQREGEALVFLIGVVMIMAIVAAIALFASVIFRHLASLHVYRETRRQMERDAARVALHLRDGEHADGGLTTVEQDDPDETRGALSSHRVEW